MNPRVRSVVATDDYKLEIEFTNGEARVFDCSHLLDFGVFRELRDLSYFKQARAEGGTVVWPHEQDICPDTLYEDSEAVGRTSAEVGKGSESEPDPARFNPIVGAIVAEDDAHDPALESYQKYKR